MNVSHYTVLLLLIAITRPNSPYRVIVCFCCVCGWRVFRWINVLLCFFILTMATILSLYKSFISSPILAHTHIHTFTHVDTPKPNLSTLRANLRGSKSDELHPFLLAVLSISISTSAEGQGNYGPFPGMWLDSWCWQPHISVFLIGFRGATRLALWHHWWSVCVCLCVCVCAERLVVFADKRWYGGLGQLCGWIPHSPMVDGVLIGSTNIWGFLFPFSWCTCASCVHGE